MGDLESAFRHHEFFLFTRSPSRTCRTSRGSARAGPCDRSPADRPWRGIGEEEKIEAKTLELYKENPAKAQQLLDGKQQRIHEGDRRCLSRVLLALRRDELPALGQGCQAALRASMYKIISTDESGVKLLQSCFNGSRVILI